MDFLVSEDRVPRAVLGARRPVGEVHGILGRAGLVRELLLPWFRFTATEPVCVLAARR
jgi:hypothetical protein